MAEPRSRVRRADERDEHVAPKRRRAEADAREEDGSESTPRRRKTTDPGRRRGADQADEERERKATRTSRRASDGPSPDQEELSGSSRPEQDGRSTKSPPKRRRPTSGIDARHAAVAAAGYVQEMTGGQPEGLTSLEHTDDGWRIGVEVLESRRIPDSTDILAEYQVDLDRDGELVSYRRARRYYRGHVGGDHDE